MGNNSSAALTKESAGNQAVCAAVENICSAPWFIANQNNVRWLRYYTSTLYQLGLVLDDILAQCAVVAAKHRFALNSPEDRRIGAFTPEDIRVMRGLFDVAARNVGLSPDCQDAQVLAKRVIHLYRTGRHDPLTLLQLVSILPRSQTRASDCH